MLFKRFFLLHLISRGLYVTWYILIFPIMVVVYLCSGDILKLKVHLKKNNNIKEIKNSVIINNNNNNK